MDVCMVDSKVIGQRLRALRGEKTVNEVASAVGVCDSALRMYEIGERMPRDTVKVRLAMFFEKTVQEIFFEP